MESINLLREFYRYNTLANQHIYAVCATVPDSERKRDLGAFFHSIHGTLNHLLLTDCIWLGRLKAVEFPVRTLRDELHTDFAELAREREKTDGEFDTLLYTYLEADLDCDLTYTSIANGITRSYPPRDVLLHICNHQTHHRGQITALIQQLGFDYGDIDLLFMPR
ncbi:MAG: damage-inducible protein DinB [Verrucomicrobiaceae bacterium]|nr:damage-inducible protein DinB [Verrucomicrobiaceae bacterium]